MNLVEFVCFVDALYFTGVAPRARSNAIYWKRREL